MIYLIALAWVVVNDFLLIALACVTSATNWHRFALQAELVPNSWTYRVIWRVLFYRNKIFLLPQRYSVSDKNAINSS